MFFITKDNNTNLIFLQIEFSFEYLLHYDLLTLTGTEWNTLIESVILLDEKLDELGILG